MTTALLILALCLACAIDGCYRLAKDDEPLEWDEPDVFGDGSLGL